MLGGWLALIAAATFAFSNVTARRGVIKGTVTQGLVITVPIGILIFLAVTLMSGGGKSLLQFSGFQISFLAAAGVFHFALARYCSFRSIQALGSNLAAPVQRLSLPISLALAILFLGEFLNAFRLLGIILVVSGPIIMLSGQLSSQNTSKIKSTNPENRFKPSYLEGYFFAFLSAIGYGVSPIFIREALQGADLITAIAGGVYSYAAAALILMPLCFLPSVRVSISNIKGEPAKWFFISGLFTGISQMVRYMALAIAPVTIVTSIMVSSLVFRFLFSRIFNRDYEVFSIWVIVGIIITMLGCLALTLEAAYIVSLLYKTEWIYKISIWRWPI